MAEQTRLVNDTITLDEALNKLELYTREAETATAAASAATSRKNAANKDVSKWSKIVIRVHREPGLPLAHYEAMSNDDDDEQRDDDDDEGRETRTRTRAPATPAPKRDDAIEQIVGRISDLRKPVTDPDNRERCVCGHKLDAPNHEPRHNSFIISLRNGVRSDIEHARACVASVPAPAAGSPQGARKKGGAKKRPTRSPAPRGTGKKKR